MDNKSQGKREARRTSVSNGTANNEFFREHYSEIRKYMSRDSFEEVPRVWTAESLRDAAEQEFIAEYDCQPSCMVFAPETITIVGTEATDLAESKSICMAIQLGTHIAGKRSDASKWCHVKILLDNYGEGGVASQVKLRANAKSPEVSNDGSWWVPYVEEAMASFRARRQERIPGFKSVIVPGRRWRANVTATCTALVVAVYTFLEAITDSHTRNAFEKALLCHLALKRVRGPFGLRLADTLVTILGQENTLFLFDARSMCIETWNWPVGQVGLVLIDIIGDESRGGSSRSNPIQSKAITTALHTSTHWNARPIDLTIMESVYPEDVICSVKQLVAQDERVLQAMAMIRQEHWKELGELLWENCRSKCECVNSLYDSAAAAIQDVIGALQTAEGVLGARILNRECGAAVLVLVQRSCWKRFAGTLSGIKSSKHQHYSVKPSLGATALYAREDQPDSQTRKKARFYRARPTWKYHLSNNFEYSQEYQSYDPAKSLSLFIPYDAVL